MVPSILVCKCGRERAVYHLGSWVCLDCGVEPWHCRCGETDGSVGRTGKESPGRNSET